MATKRKSKAAKAATIYNRFANTLPRQKVIAKFVKQVGLTEKGASTYYTNLKNKAAA